MLIPPLPPNGPNSLLSSRSYHIHDLHQAEAEVYGERVGVVEHRSLQSVVIFHEVSIQPPLMLSLNGCYEDKRVNQLTKGNSLFSDHFLPERSNLDCTSSCRGSLQHCEANKKCLQINSNSLSSSFGCKRIDLGLSSVTFCSVSELEPLSVLEVVTHYQLSHKHTYLY